MNNVEVVRILYSGRLVLADLELPEDGVIVSRSLVVRDFEVKVQIDVCGLKSRKFLRSDFFEVQFGDDGLAGGKLLDQIERFVRISVARAQAEALGPTQATAGSVTEVDMDEIEDSPEEALTPPEDPL